MLTSTQPNRFRFSLIFIMSLLMVAVLAACGDNPTAVPATTPTSVTATTITAAGDLTVPKFDNLKELSLGSEIEDIIIKSFPPNLVLKLYGATDEPKTVAASLDATLTKLSFVKDTSITGPVSMLEGIGAVYNTSSKTMLLTVGFVPKDADTLAKGINILGLSVDAGQKLYDQLKDYKSVVMLLLSTNVSSSPVASGNLTLPKFDNLKEITLGSEVESVVTASLFPHSVLKLYGATDDPKIVAANLDVIMSKTSFVKFDTNNSTTYIEDAIVFSYHGGGKLLSLSVGSIPTDAATLASWLSIPQLSANGAQKLYDQLKGFKSFVALIIL